VALSHNTAITVTTVESITDGSAQAVDKFEISASMQFTDGAGAQSANKQWNDSRTLGGASETLDLAGSLTSRVATAASFAKIKSVYIKAAAANAGNIVVGSGSNPLVSIWTGTVILQPGADFLIRTPSVNGYAVTAGTGDILQVAGATGYVYEIAITGE
jgi:hypothetical protein